MIIRTNVYKPILQEEHAKARGSKEFRLVVAGIVLAVAPCAWGVALHADVARLRGEYAREQAEGKKLSKELGLARALAQELAAKDAQRSAICGFARDRVVWAPLLERIFASVPETVELTTVECRCSSPKDRSIRIVGQATSQSPRLLCDKFRIQVIDTIQTYGLRAAGDFTRLDDSETSIELEGVKYLKVDFEILITWNNAADEKKGTH
jgi:hypothetical protein